MHVAKVSLIEFQYALIARAAVDLQSRKQQVKGRAGKNVVFFLQKIGFRFLVFKVFKRFLGFNLQMPDTKLRPTGKDSAM